MFPFGDIKLFNMIEDQHIALRECDKGFLLSRLVIKVGKMLSIMALSLKLPRRLMLFTMP